MDSKPRTLYILLAVSTVLAILLAFDLAPILRGGFGWQWPYDVLDGVEWARLVGLLAALASYLGVGWWLMGREKAAAFIVWAALGAVLLPVLTTWVRMPYIGYGYYRATADAVGTGWYQAGLVVREGPGLREALINYPDQMFAFREAGLNHITTSPPGHWLLYYWASDLFEMMPSVAAGLAHPLRAYGCIDPGLLNLSNAELASAWVGMTLPRWGALVAILLWLFGRVLFNERVGRWAALLWPLLPSLLIFNPYPSPFNATLSLLAMALLALGLDRDQWPGVFLGGVVLSYATFNSFIFLPVLLFAGTQALLFFFVRYTEREYQWWWPFVQGAIFGAGLLSAWLIFYLYSGITPLDIFVTSMDWHLNLELAYLPWVFLHFNDFVLFMGWPLFFIGVPGIVMMTRRTLKGEAVSGGVLLALACAITVIVLDISGMARGESGRSWIIFMPFMLYAAAIWLDGAAQDRGVLLRAAAMQLVVIGVVVAVMRPMAVYPPPDHLVQPEAASPPGDVIPVLEPVTFEDTVRLNAYSGAVNGDILTLWLSFEADGPLDRPYWLSILPVGPDGMPGAASVVPPYLPAETFPMTCWFAADDPVIVTQAITLPADAAGGDWWISLALIDAETGATLPVSVGESSGEMQVGLGPFEAK